MKIKGVCIKWFLAMVLVAHASAGVRSVFAEEAHPVPDGTPRAVTMDTLIGDGLSNSPALRAKKAEYEAARSKAINRWLPMDPMVGVDVQGQPDLLKTGRRTDYEYMVSQSIPFPTKLLLNGMIASKEADMAYQAYKEEERAVIWSIEQPSYQLFLSQRTAKALEENKSLLDQFASVVKSRYESGASDQSDTLKVQIELAQVSIEIFDWRQKARIAEAAVSRQLNKPLDTQYSIEERSKRDPFPYSIGDFEKIALAKRPELKSVKIAVERAKDSRLLAQTEWLPDITGRIAARQYKGEDDIREYDNFIGVSVPVWSLLKGIGGGWKGAGEEVRAAEALYADMKNEVLFRVHEAYAKFLSAQNALDSYESVILPQAKQQVDISLSSYEAGKKDILDLIDAQRTLKNTQIGYYKAMSDHEMALSDLRLAIGDPLEGAVESKEKLS